MNSLSTLFAILLIMQAPAPPPAESPRGTGELVQEHQRRGDAALLAGRFADAYWYYIQAYELTLPIADYEAREVLRGKIHRTLTELAQIRGDVGYLCQAWHFHERHALTLMREGVSGASSAVQRSIAEIEAGVLERSGRPANRICAGRALARPLMLAGIPLLTLGISSVSVASYALVDYAHSRDLLRKFPEEKPVVEGHKDSSLTVGLVAVAAGIVLTTVGAALLVRARRSRPALPLLTRVRIEGSFASLRF